MNGDNMLGEMLELVFLCLVFIGVLGLTYFVTKKIGMINKKMNFNRNIEIIEMLPIMQGQYLCIIKVGTGYHLVGCSQKGQMVYLKELSSEQLDLREIKHESFQEQFIQLVKGKQETKDEKQK